MHGSIISEADDWHNSYESNDYAEKETSYYIAACYKPLCIQ